MKKTIAITAPTGMLGSMVYNIFKDKYNLVLIYRDAEKLKKLDEKYGGISAHRSVQFNLFDLYKDYANQQKDFAKENIEKFINEIGEVDAFVNCAGIIIPQSLRSPVETFFINAGLPNILSSIYKNKLLHITTDCVYDGQRGAPYDEESLKSPKDLYGLSKSLGEPMQHSLVLRTSIIGPELSGNVSLLEWVKSQEGKTIEGYTNHIWNGLTTKQMAMVFSKIIDNRVNFPRRGLYHIFSNDVSKYELVRMIKEKYNLNLIIQPKETRKVDRRLSSIYSMQKELQIPALDEMIRSL